MVFPRFFIVCDLKELETRGPAFHTSVAVDWQEVGLLGPMLMGRVGLIGQGLPHQLCWSSPRPGGLLCPLCSHRSLLVNLGFSLRPVLFLFLLYFIFK